MTDEAARLFVNVWTTFGTFLAGERDMGRMRFPYRLFHSAPLGIQHSQSVVCVLAQRIGARGLSEFYYCFVNHTFYGILPAYLIVHIAWRKENPCIGNEQEQEHGHYQSSRPADMRSPLAALYRVSTFLHHSVYRLQSS